jgi:hypothetical protein
VVTQSACTAWHCDETLNDTAFIDEELAELTGRTGSWTLEPLVHNPKNAVTAGISRVSTDGWSAVLKVVSLGRTSESHWAASHDPSHWNYWRREVYVYESDLAADGAPGEDIGNLIPDSVFDLFLPADRLPELDELVYGSYVDGLRAAGWAGDERLVRLAVCASAAKYTWLVPFMLSRASDEEHPDYGGAGTVPAARRYAERGATLMFLAGWADEARELAGACGR